MYTNQYTSILFCFSKPSHTSHIQQGREKWAGNNHGSAIIFIIIPLFFETMEKIPRDLRDIDVDQ